MMKPEECIIYSKEELDAIRSAKDLLLDINYCKSQKRKKAFTETEISLRHLAITVLICKSRPNEAAGKYIQWLTTISDYWGIDEFNDAQLTNPPKRSDKYLQSYRIAGRDVSGACIFWIDGRNAIPNDVEEEKLSILAGIRYHMAVHANAKTSREGLTFVIDVSNKPKEKVGNERRLQSSYNNYPLRPQHIFIVGASKIVRLSVNSLLKVTGLFSKVKILKRIKFVTLEQVCDLDNGGTVPKESLPKHLKTKADKHSLEYLMANVKINEEKKEDKKEVTHDDDENIVEWVNERITKIPIPVL